MGSKAPGARRPIFVRITVGLLAMLLVCGAAIALLLLRSQNGGDENARGTASSQPVAEKSEGSLRPRARGVNASTLPEDLLQHFRSRGIVLRPEARYGGQLTEWILEHADVGPRCEALTSFVSFPSGAEVAAMENYVMDVSVPSVLNEQAGLAMFYPHGRGKTSDIGACQDWSVKSKAIVNELLEAFKSYQR